MRHALPGVCRMQQMTQMDTNNLLSKQKVLSMLGIGDKALRRLIKRGRLQVVKLGKTSPLKFRQLDVARFLENSVVTGI